MLTPIGDEDWDVVELSDGVDVEPVEGVDEVDVDPGDDDDDGVVTMDVVVVFVTGKLVAPESKVAVLVEVVKSKRRLAEVDVAVAVAVPSVVSVVEELAILFAVVDPNPRRWQH